jgi:hypothetical protein
MTEDNKKEEIIEAQNILGNINAWEELYDLSLTDLNLVKKFLEYMIEKKENEISKWGIKNGH